MMINDQLTQIWIEMFFKEFISEDLSICIKDDFYTIQNKDNQLSLLIKKNDNLGNSNFISAQKIHKSNSYFHLDHFIEDEFIFFDYNEAGNIVEKVNSTQFLIKPKIIDYIFWTVNRLEEINESINFDDHNRFHPEEMFAFKNDFLERPIVDEYTWLIRNICSKIWPDLILKKDSFFNCNLSCDIDHPFLSKRPRIKVLKESLSKMIKEKDIYSSFEHYFNFEFSKIFGIKHDKYLRGIKRLKEIAENKEIKILFFLLLRRTNMIHDEFIDSEHSDYIDMIKDLYNANHTIGLHPGYGCDKDENFKHSVEDFLRFCDKNHINIREMHSRMHYLRFDVKNTINQLEKFKITNDHSLGFTDKIGFRTGSCQPQKLINFRNNSISETYFHSLNIMDHCIIDSKKESDIEQKIYNASILINRVKFYKGNLNILWHNSSLNSKLELKALEKILSFT